MVDIRIPIGLMFTLLGVLIGAYGLATVDSEMYSRSLGINVNIIMGIIMLLFGVVMLYLSRKKKKV
jgi:cytochrome c biogenesis protein CcdA